MKEEFAEGINNKCGGNEDCCGLKRKLLDVASEVCGYTKGKPRHFEMWWNKDVDVVLCRKIELFRQRLIEAKIDNGIPCLGALNLVSKLSKVKKNIVSILLLI